MMRSTRTGGTRYPSRFHTNGDVSPLGTGKPPTCSLLMLRSVLWNRGALRLVRKMFPALQGGFFKTRRLSVACKIKRGDAGRRVVIVRGIRRIAAGEGWGGKRFEEARVRWRPGTGEEGAVFTTGCSEGSFHQVSSSSSDSHTDAAASRASY